MLKQPDRQVHPSELEILASPTSVGGEPDHKPAAQNDSKPEQLMSKNQQFRALAFKAVSYQKRQMFTNICCICMCPLMMVVISAGLGTFINLLIARSATSENILFCGNNASLNDAGFPIWNISDSRIYGSTVTDGKSVNYYSWSASDGSFSGLGSQKFPCVRWFGQKFPQFSSIYERNYALTGFSKMDSTFLDPPDYGWITEIGNLYTSGQSDYITLYSLFSQFQTNPWLLSAAASGYSTYLGARPSLSSFTTTNAYTYGTTNAIQPYQSWTQTADSNGYFGLLGTLENRLYANFSSGLSSVSYNRIPYAQPVSTASSDNDLDDQLSSLLSKVITGLANLNKTAITSKSATKADLIAFYASAAQVTQIMPYGALWLNNFNPSTLSMSSILHFGTDNRVSASGSFPTDGLRQLLMVTQLDQASLRGLLSSSYGSATITQGIRAFPQVRSTQISIQAGALIGRILYPFGVSFLLPIFTIMLVKEKEDRIYIMMKLNGLKGSLYYASHYIVFYVLYILSTIVFIIAGSRSGLTFFTQTDMGVIVILFFVWGHVQIVLAFFFSTLFNKSRIALVLVFLVVLVGVIISLVSDYIFIGAAPSAYFIWPPFAFYRALGLINTASYVTTKQPYKLKALVQGDEVYTTICFLIGEVFVYGFVSIYLALVIPSEFGTNLKWHFPVTMPYAYYQKSKRRRLNRGVDPLSESQLALAVTIDESETKYEDIDVKAEKTRIEMLDYPKDAPLVISHMRKVYPSRKGLGPKFAVKDVSFAAEIGQVFGLLGPNGAGKTTLISILTGLYTPSSGHGIMAGYDLRADSTDICKVMGICPQFDILWEDLTVEEHLYFYARMKGATKQVEDAYVNQALANVSLTSLRFRLSKRLSGGEKRRLSIAIALIGTPKVVFLDEPTTGLDPEVRRLIWSIVHEAKKDKAVILTTHSMEEAEALCHRIGIMAKGTMRCLANSLRLKELYGTGFRLFFNTMAQDTVGASKWVEGLLPSGFHKVDAFTTMTSYEFPSTQSAISSIFSSMEAGKAKNGILDWGISQTSLEDVFIKIISEDDANAD
ncbi:hypothetical protein BC830DRAFT_1143991 [Chytriomyces sp. MP71]|nr:hypothetical protein BC830DRAFT_1143991 [Chytriomyces sp. MP71]